MRVIKNPQMSLGEMNIAEIELDPKSRDDIPQILRGLQHIYITAEIREKVFSILKEILVTDKDGNKVDSTTGRPGMSQWKILVLGVLRLGLNSDYDRIHQLANEHKTIRQMLGHSDWIDDTYYSLQTIKDNLRLFTPELLDRINQEVINAGHQALKKKPDESLTGRCDSFVVETDVHFPTDINLLLDAVRKMLSISAELAEANDIMGWREYRYHQRQFKNQYRFVQRLKHSTSRDENKQQKQQELILQAYETYLEMAQGWLLRCEYLGQQLSNCDIFSYVLLDELKSFMKHAQRQIDQIRRRVIQGETIPHEEKVFSLFEPHTEWISKGKAGVSVELGLRVCIMEDKDHFILHHQVMEKMTDDKVAVSMVDETMTRFPNLNAVSMDKGFHSQSNQQDLKERLDIVVLPRKGRLSKTNQTLESEDNFVQLRLQHSGVESAINALEQHGLDKCPDHGISGFKRYVALAVVARNIQRLGAILHQQEQEKEQRKRGPYKKAA